jgi:hypothetical protein
MHNHIQEENMQIQKLGFKPHDENALIDDDSKEKTISAKISPEIFQRWLQIKNRLAAYGEVQLASVVRNSFLEALDALEKHAAQLESNQAVTSKSKKERDLV